MSLKAAAKHIAAQGRNGDSMLVHMTPREVAGLHALAHAHGKGLTTNPQTGLPEAFILESLLPSLASSSLQKGLLAGLGAFGGLKTLGGLFGGDRGSGAPKEKDNPYRYRFDMNPTGVRPSGMDEEQQYFKPSYTAMADGGVTRMAEGGNPYSYEYDPVLQRYVEKKSFADPAGGFDSAAKFQTQPRAEGSSYETTRPKAVEDYLTWEETSPDGRAARDARMQGVQALLSYTLPGAALAAKVQGREVMPIGQAFRQTFLTPQAYKDFAEREAAVESRNKEVEQNASKPGFDRTWGGGLAGTLGDQEGDYDLPTPDLDRLSTGYESVGGPGTYGGRSTEAAAEAAAAAASAAEAAAASETSTETSTDSDNSGEKNGGLLRRRVGGLAALAQGGYSHLGDYSDGGRLLRGPGDGVSDSIPATIGDKRPARLADGEFVVPARIVSELGNGSTEAGARKLYAMMDRIQKNRSKTVGKGKVAVNSRSDKALPA